MKRVRKTFNEASSERVKDLFKRMFSYDPDTGEINNIRKNRLYTRKTIKGYRECIYITVDTIEYRSTYHRLCWFLHTGTLIPDNMQIDHINNIKDDNRIVNLRVCTNESNSKKKLLRVDNKTGYRGVQLTSDNNGRKIYHYYSSSITIKKGAGPTKIGRFKDSFYAAIFYDSANRYYFKDFASCNFEKEYLKPMSILELRNYKRAMKPLPEMDENKNRGELLES